MPVDDYITDYITGPLYINILTDQLHTNKNSVIQYDITALLDLSALDCSIVEVLN